MSILTEKYGLFKYDTATDGLQKFNINTALNDNWDKVETVMSENETTLSETKTNVESLREGLTKGSVIASRAANDAEGNNLIQTYETKSNANTARNELSTNINTRINNLDSEVKNLIANGDSTTLASAKSYTNTVKNDLLNGAGEAYDTLKELGDLINENVDAIDALETVATNKADKEHTHNFIKEINNGLEQKFWRGTKAEYDAIETKDEATMYIIIDGEGGEMSITVDEEVIEGSKNAVSSGAVYNAITAVSADIDKRVPAWTSADEGEFLRIVNGAPAWATVQNAEEVSF